MSTYTYEFKKQIVSLCNNKKPANEIFKEYKISRSALYQLVKQFNNTQHFKAKDNRTPEESELIKLKKLAQSKMENDICPKG